MKQRSVLFVVVILCLNLLVNGAASASSSQPPNPASRVAGPNKPASAATGASFAEPAVALGQPGTSFRYIRTFGVTQEAYPGDVQHLNHPASVFVDSHDDLFVVEELGSRLLKYRTSSDGSNLLSIGVAGLQNRGSYTFDRPKDVAVDSSGHIWVVDNSRAAEYDPSGQLLQEFPAEDPWNSGSDNGHFNDPRGLAFDGAGRLFVADASNHRIQIFEMIGGKPVYKTTIGTTGVTGTAPGYFNYPNHLAFDSSGRLYVMDTFNYRVQRCTPADAGWSCTTFFGQPGEPGSDLQHLSGWTNGIEIRNDTIYIADSDNERVLKCNTSGSCGVFVGVSGESGSDNTHLYSPSDAAVDSKGNVYVSEYDNDRVQKFSSDGAWLSRIGVTRVPYVPDTTRYNTPYGITVAADGSIFFVESWGGRLVKINASGVQQWAVGEAGVFGSDNAHFRNVWWAGLAGNVAVDAAGRVYVPDSGNDRIQIFDASSGAFVATWGSYGSGPSRFSCPWGVTISPVNGDLYVTDRCNNRVQVFDSNRVFKMQLGTGAAGAGNSQFASPQGAGIDKQGNVYVADHDNNRVQKCSISGTTYSCNTFAGVTGQPGDDFGHLCGPHSVAIDVSGRVYVTDSWNQRVQVYDRDGAYLGGIGGNWGSRSSEFMDPKGLALDSQGNVYVTDSRNSRIQKFAPGVPGWRQTNINGFGDSRNGAVTALEVFDGQLYAGTWNWAQGATVWRTADGSSWTRVSEPAFGNTAANANRAILDMTVFKGQLYATAGWFNDDPGKQIWRTANGTTWTLSEGNGFGNADNNAVSTLTVWNDRLYACTFNWTSGLEIWRSASGDPGQWSRVVSGGNGTPTNANCSGFQPFDGYLYATVENKEYGAQIWRTLDGVAWTSVATGGFGDAANQNASGAVVFNGALYAGTSNDAIGGQLWRSTNGTDWTPVGAPGLGNKNNQKPDGLIVFGGQLYVFEINAVTGVEAWRSSDGFNFTRINPDGFGDGSQTFTLWSSTVAVFRDGLTVGTGSFASSPGKVWRLLNEVYLPLVMR